MECMIAGGGLHKLALVDSSAAAGSAKKGRSSSKMLHARCRHIAAICVAGSLEFFFGWIPMWDKRLDEPSS